MKKIILLFFICISSTLFSQTAPSIEWQNTIGGGGSDVLVSVQQTFDGGYIIGGSSSSNISVDKTENCMGSSDYWIVKLDALGDISWQNTIGGDGSDGLVSIQQTLDGGYILGGSSDSGISGDKMENSNGTSDYWIVKLDALGNISWQNTIGGSSIDYLESIKQTFDGGYILGGWSSSNISGDKSENSNGMSDYWIVKLDSLGVIVWQNTIGGDNMEYFYSIQQTLDGGYILGGSSSSSISGDKTENPNGLYDYWVVKLDSLGVIIWQNTIGSATFDYLQYIQQTSDRGYILGGYSDANISGDKTENSNGYYDYWVVKLDSLGAIVWQNTIGGNSDDYLKCIQQTLDGGYILGGYSKSNISGDKTENNFGDAFYHDFWVIKLDSLGNIVWQNTIGGNAFDQLLSVQQTNDGGYVLGGHSTSSISGDKTEMSIGEDYWVVKLGYISSIEDENYMVSFYPNPTSDFITIESNIDFSNSEMLVLNSLGEIVQSNRNTNQISVQHLASGIYFLRLIYSVGEKVFKVVKR